MIGCSGREVARSGGFGFLLARSAGLGLAHAFHFHRHGEDRGMVGAGAAIRA
jgi:hypothetical protein